MANAIKPINDCGLRYLDTFFCADTLKAELLKDEWDAILERLRLADAVVDASERSLRILERDTYHFNQVKEAIDTYRSAVQGEKRCLT